MQKKGVTIFRSGIKNISAHPGLTRNRPILVGVTFPGATSESVTYAYGGTSLVDELSRNYYSVELTQGTGINGTTILTSGDDQWHTTTYVNGTDAKATLDNTHYGWIHSAETIDGFFYLKKGTYPLSTRLYGEAHKDYIYDARNNVKEIRTMNAAGSLALSSVVATYPDACTEDTLKTCNKPLTVKDNNGNITTYTYHLPSGQVESVTSPLVGTLRAQTRYEYTAKTASASQIANAPIYLKTKESSCANSNFSGAGDGYSRFTGTCAGADEVVTQYEYEPNNLLLISSVVTANGKSQRTCFSYDKYGNPMGKTLPQAFLTSCP